ncbi:hypothetical protein [Aliivibrio sp.]|uniref:hypothetical protein n=1 Tax=Aliivibrio sp. TaxID=1872443 RepID=UPI003D2F1A80
MRLSEKRRLKVQLTKELDELQENLNFLSEERQDLDRADWQYVNAKFNQMVLKVETKQNEIWRLGGQRGKPAVVKYFSMTQPMRQMIFN